jgi:predicted esterase
VHSTRRVKSRVALGVLAIGWSVTAIGGCRRASADSAPAGSSGGVAEAPRAGAAQVACANGWQAIDGNACVTLPEHFADPPSVLIFAHGIIAPGVEPLADQATLLKAAHAHGFAVIFARGRAGLCEWDAGVADSICWPTRPETVRREAPGIVAEWTEAEGRAAALAGVTFQRRYLLGFSNGGYFATYVLMDALMHVDGAGVVGAGRTTIDDAQVVASPVPLYVAVGGEEAGSTRQDASVLAHTLTARSWPVTYRVHPERAHELGADDLAAAWTAWGR